MRVECKDRETLRVKYSLEAETDANGTYEIMVEDDHEDQICECALVSSPIANCRLADPGRSRASALLTRYMNGVVNSRHTVNNMGFLQDEPLAGCKELLKKYLPTDEDQ